jgi:5-oxoprolinase (ATP-hydrolysing)
LVGRDHAKDHVVLRRAAPRARAHAVGTRADPVMLEVFNNLFMSIAEQMGVTLQNTAYSVNIKERLDFSCASSTPPARWSPTHRTCRCISAPWTARSTSSASSPRYRAGDVYALNAPYNGGTHLPDITVVTPVFADSGPMAVRKSSSGWRPAAIMPMSAAPRRAR